MDKSRNFAYNGTYNSEIATTRCDTVLIGESDTLQEIWDKGFVSNRRLTPDSIAFEFDKRTLADVFRSQRLFPSREPKFNGV